MQIRFLSLLLAATLGVCAAGRVAAAPATGLEAARAGSDAVNTWAKGLSQSGWRLVAVSQSQQSALMIGPERRDAVGRRITTARYEFMAPSGDRASLVAEDAIDCQSSTIARLKVTGYAANNLGGQETEMTADAAPVSTLPFLYLEQELHSACRLG